jgi:small subunit ribosomal protein S8
MAANDTIADMLTRIRNANMARHQTTQIPATKMTRSIAKVLQNEGFIGEFQEAEEGVKRNLVVSLNIRGIASR